MVTAGLAAGDDGRKKEWNRMLQAEMKVCGGPGVERTGAVGDAGGDRSVALKGQRRG